MEAPDRSAETVGDWLALVDHVYPERDAAEWDAPGLQVGDPADAVAAVLVSLDVTEAVVDEAVERGATLVLAHHPLLLHGLARLTPATTPGRVALHAARHGVAIAAAHTNLDVAVPGTSHPVAEVLVLQGLRPLRPRPLPAQHKLVTFVPRDATPAVLDALEAAGAGHIGAYRGCASTTPSTGVFRPTAAADPTIGEHGERELVDEDRVETLVDADRVDAVLAALRAAHPYEEVAVDLLQLVPVAPTSGEPAPRRGLGLVGDLPAPERLGDLAQRIADDLPSPTLRLAGDPDRQVARIAVCGGAGQSLIDDALAAGADVLVTADLRHHPSLDALGAGLALIDADHHATEAAALPAAMARLENAARHRGLHAVLLASRVSTAPWVPPARWGPSRAEPGSAGPSATLEHT